MNVQETLPTELRMAAPPSIPQARSYLFKQRSEYTDYEMGKGAKIRINIPRLQRTYLSKDSYIRFRLNLEAATPSTLPASNAGIPGNCGPVYLDRAGAYSLFDRMEVYDYMGGTLIEQVNNIPALACMINDIACPVGAFNGKMQAVQGYEGSMVSVSTVATATQQEAANGFEIRTSNSGCIVIPGGWNNATANTKAFFTVEFSIPLLSFLGNFSSKFVPLHNGFSIDLYLNQISQAFISRGLRQILDPPPANYYYGEPPRSGDAASATVVNSAWVSNAELCAQVMELGNDAENLVLSSNGAGPLVIPSVFYRYFTDLVKGYGEADQTSSVGMDLNLNVVSLRNIRFGMRPASYQNSTLYPAYGHRIRNYMENFSFRYGSSFLPELAGIACRSTTVPISKIGTASFATASENKSNGYTQSYAELLKTGLPLAWSNFTSSSSINGTEYACDLFYGPSNASLQSGNMVYYDRAAFTNAATVPPLGKFVNHQCGKFMGGLDLRLSSKDVISGIDTNGLLVRLNALFDDDNLSNMVNAVLDVYAEYDAFVQIIPGTATTVTF